MNAIYFTLSKLKSKVHAIVFAFATLAFMMPYQSQASHVVGSDASYACISNRVYQVTAKIYRDCAGIQLCFGCQTGTSPVPCSQQVTITGRSHPTGIPHNLPAQSCNGTSFGSVNLSVVPGVSGLDVIQLCAMSVTICRNCNTRTPGTFQPGIEVYTFTGTVDLTGLPASCCWVAIGIPVPCCRNNAITTLVNPGSLNLYNEVMINICATPCNSSPTFTNDPVAITCAGQDFTYNLGAIDPDGDSLSYRFGHTQIAPGVGAAYASPFSPNAPFPYLGVPGQSPPLLPPLGIYIDPFTGDLRFRPQGTFVTNMVVEVLQWKLVNGVYVLMGITRRDIQFYSQVCPENYPPVIRTYDDNGILTTPQPNLNWAVCAGQQLCFQITAWDNTAGWDTTDLTWNQASSGADPNPIFNTGGTVTRLYNVNQRKTFGPMKDSIRFCWTPPASVARNLPYFFIVNAKDRACPIPSRTTRAFGITVRPIPTAIINKINRNCGFYDFTFTQTNTVALNPTYTQFQVETAPGSGSFVTYAGSSVSNHRFNTGGWHKVRLRLTTTPIPPSLPNGCPNNNILDSVLVITPVDVTARDTFNCFQTPVVVPVKGTHGTPYGTSYRYTFYSGGLTGTNVIRIFGPDSNASINPAVSGVTSSYKVVIQDLNGCRDSAVFNIFTRNLPLKELPPSIRFCFGTSDTVDAGNSAGSVNVWRWSKSPVTPLLSDSTLQKIIPPDSGRYVVRKTDNFGCQIRDTIMVYVNAQVPVSAGPDRTICFNDPPININATGTTAAIDSFQWRQIPITPTSPVISNSATLTVSPAALTQYQVTGFITYGGITCSYVDTMEVKVNPLPVINRPSNISLCRNFGVVLMPNITSTNKPGAITSAWSYPQNPMALTGNQLIIDSLRNLPPPPPTQARGNIIRLTVNDNDGCTIRDSMIVSIFPVPIINAGLSRRFCDYDPIFNINPGTQGYVPNGGAFATNEEWFGRGIYKPNPAVNFFAFNQRAADVKLFPDTNIISYKFTATFPMVNAVVFSPAILGYTAPSPAGGCQSLDTAIFRVIKTPILEAGIAPPVCKSATSFDINAHMIGRSTTSTDPLTSYWYFGAPDQAYRPAISNGRTFDPQHPIIPTFTKIYRLVYADTSTTCRVADTTELQVNQNPDVLINYMTMQDSAVCKTKGTVTFLLSPSGIFSTDGTLTSTPTLSPTLFDVTNGTFQVGTVPAGTYAIRYYYKDPATQCDNSDTINIRLQEPPQVDITDDGQVCEYGAVFNVNFNKAPDAPYTVAWSTPDGNGTIQPNANGISYIATPADIARGRISFRATTVDLTTDPDVCAAVSDSATYIIKPKPLADFTIAPDRGCVDPRYGTVLNSVFTAQTSTAPGSIYKWFMNQTDYNQTPMNPAPFDQLVMNQTFTTSGTYNIHLFVEAQGCTDTLVQQVQAWPAPVAAFTPNPRSTTIAKPFFDFANQSSILDGSPLSYIWTFPPDAFGGAERKDYTESPQRVRFMADTGDQIVRLTAISINGCYDSTQRDVTIEPDITVFIPNVFRPVDASGNGGAVNDGCGGGCNRVFKVSATGFETIEIFVFNRWGQMVYKYNATSETFSEDEGWNGKDFNVGKDCQQDAYIYQINASSFSGKKYAYSGSITLLR
jgi:hypothetical protein